MKGYSTNVYLPKKERACFHPPDAYHLVTHVKEAAGDNKRMSLAGFFFKKETRLSPNTS